MDITTTYLGLTLKSPLVASASPLSTKLDNIKRMEDAGAGAVVLASLFEEQIRHESQELDHYLEYGAHSYAEAVTYLPPQESFRLAPEKYLDHLRKSKEAVDMPVIASLNGSTTGGWTSYAKKMEEAGADALELNIYYIPTETDTDGGAVEHSYVNTLKAVKETVSIPVALKIGPYFSNMANMAKRFDENGANGLVLFNRFYQPDIDIENLEVYPNIQLSSSVETRLPMRWIAILYNRIKADMAATSGIHTAKDVLKLLMAGAKVTMMASSLMQNGIDHIRNVEVDMRQWMEEHEYESVVEMQGTMSQQNSPNPANFERAQYMQGLQEFVPPSA